MKSRSIPIVIIGFVFIITGCIGLIYHTGEYFEQGSVKYEGVRILFIRVLAIVCGLLLIRGVNWARWLTVTWLAYHVVLSLFHSALETIIHFALLAVVSYLLFMPKSSAYFRRPDRGSEKNWNE